MFYSDCGDDEVGNARSEVCPNSEKILYNGREFKDVPGVDVIMNALFCG